MHDYIEKTLDRYAQQMRHYEEIFDRRLSKQTTDIELRLETLERTIAALRHPFDKRSEEMFVRTNKGLLFPITEDQVVEDIPKEQRNLCNLCEAPLPPKNSSGICEACLRHSLYCVSCGVCIDPDVCTDCAK